MGRNGGCGRGSGLREGLGGLWRARLRQGRPGLGVLLVPALIEVVFGNGLGFGGIELGCLVEVVRGWIDRSGTRTWQVALVPQAPPPSTIRHRYQDATLLNGRQTSARSRAWAGVGRVSSPSRIRIPS